MTRAERILIVEDDPEIREDLGALLESEGYSVVQAANGHEALQTLRSQPAPCLILLDLMMPVMNGWDFRAVQLADPVLQAIPTVVLTGAPLTPDDTERLRVSALVTKPFGLKPLLQVIERYC